MMKKIRIHIKKKLKKRRSPIIPTQVHSVKTKENRKRKSYKKTLNEQLKEAL